jgi:hypothetical protein
VDAVVRTVTGAVGEQTVLLTVDVSTDSGGTVSNVDGAAQLSGTVFCSEPTQAYVHGRVTQKSGRDVASGFFYTSFVCNGLTPWSVTVVPDQGRFVSGRARVQTTVDAYDFETGTYVTTVQEEVIISLRNEPSRNP